MPQVILDVSPEIQERVNFLSRENDKSPNVFIMNILKERLEDMEDYEEAVKISAEIESGRMKTYSLEEIEREMAELDAVEN